MAEGLLKSFDYKLEVYSAGTKPAERVHPKAVQVTYRQIIPRWLTGF